MIFHHDKVPFKLRYCSIFKVLCRSPSRDSFFIISHQVLFVKHFFEIFLSTFQRLAVSRDSLIIIPHKETHVNTFFEIYFIFFFPSNSLSAPLYIKEGTGRFPPSLLLYICPGRADSSFLPQPAFLQMGAVSFILTNRGRYSTASTEFSSPYQRAGDPATWRIAYFTVKIP